MKPIFLDLSHKTDLGTSRELNEDSCLTALAQTGMQGGVRGVLVVSDGMGGHDAGDVASKMTCDYLEHLFVKGNYLRHAQEWEIAADDYAALLMEAMYSVNRKIIERARSFNLMKTMGCTCVVCLIIYDESRSQWKLVIGSVGDSRCYIVRDGEVLLATEDDSFVWQLYKKKEITYAEMRMHPKRNVLTQALGAQDTIRPSVRLVDLREDDVIVLCSDGFHATASEDDLRKIVVTSNDAGEVVQRLVDLANNLGSRDNIAVAVARCRKEEAIPVAKQTSGIARAFAVGLPVVMLGVGSLFLLNSSPGIPEVPLSRHVLTIGSGPSLTEVGSTVLLRFSLEPYSLIEQSKTDYSLICEDNRGRDTIPLSRIREAGRNDFHLPYKIPSNPSGPLRLLLTHASQSRPLYESMLVFDNRRKPNETPVRQNEQKEVDRPDGPRVPDFVTVTRGPDGFVQVWLSKQFEIHGDATAELSMDGVVEILTLDSQNKVVPKSTSVEYRAGETILIRLLGTPHTWTMRLP